MCHFSWWQPRTGHSDSITFFMPSSVRSSFLSTERLALYQLQNNYICFSSATAKHSFFSAVNKYIPCFGYFNFPWVEEPVNEICLPQATCLPQAVEAFFDIFLHLLLCAWDWLHAKTLRTYIIYIYICICTYIHTEVINGLSMPLH